MGTMNTADNDNYSNPTAYDLINFLKAACQVKTCERKISCPYNAQYLYLYLFASLLSLPITMDMSKFIHTIKL